jgi:hypothetical protein
MRILAGFWERVLQAHINTYEQEGHKAKKAMETDRRIAPEESVQHSRSVTSRLNKIYSRQQSSLDADLNREQMKLLEKEKW